MLYSELRKKEVINIRNCQKLGHVCDMEIDVCRGCILKVVVPGVHGWWGWLKEECVTEIAFSCIKQIGADIILVEI